MNENILYQIRRVIIFFIALLWLSGLTTIPLKAELRLLNDWLGPESFFSAIWSDFSVWIGLVSSKVIGLDESYEFLFYGMDWLAFGHIIIGLFFIGVIKDPIRNIWIVECGILACLLVIPVALFFGALRDIPFFWRLIDCSFGVFGLIPLLWVRSKIRTLEQN